LGLKARVKSYGAIEIRRKYSRGYILGAIFKGAILKEGSAIAH
jgi:hypothetical protein